MKKYIKAENINYTKYTALEDFGEYLQDTTDFTIAGINPSDDGSNGDLEIDGTIDQDFDPMIVLTDLSTASTEVEGAIDSLFTLNDFYNNADSVYYGQMAEALATAETEKYEDFTDSEIREEAAIRYIKYTNRDDTIQSLVDDYIDEIRILLYDDMIDLQVALDKYLDEYYNNKEFYSEFIAERYSF